MMEHIQRYEEIVAAIQERSREGALRCGNAFHIAAELNVTPLDVGRAADAIDIQLNRCQLGLFGYNGEERIVQPAEEIPAEVEQAIHEGLVLGRLPCAVAWAIARRFDLHKPEVANIAERLEIRIGQCQLGAF